MALRLGTTMRNAACNAITGAIGASGTLKIYTGSQPGAVSGNPSGTLLGTLTLSATPFGAASTGVATANSISSDSSADASGTAGHAVISDGSANPLADMTCGQGSGDLSFDNNVIVAGGVIAVTSMTLTVPVS